MNWNDFKNFSEREFACSHTGECNMSPAFIYLLQKIRDITCKPMFVSSGYRSWQHPLEVGKEKPGAHTLGVAADIICHGKHALDIIKAAQDLGIRRIGIHQKGNVNGRFVHLDIADRLTIEHKDGVWTY